jgi:hypothetical protein
MPGSSHMKKPVKAMKYKRVSGKKADKKIMGKPSKPKKPPKAAPKKPATRKPSQPTRKPKSRPSKGY